MSSFNSLKKSTDFKTIHTHAQEKKTRFLVIKYCNQSTVPTIKNSNNYPILGITISRKIGKAVTRNLIKRRLKSIFAEYCKYHDIQNMIFSFYTKKSIAYSNYQELKKDVDKILKSI